MNLPHPVVRQSLWPLLCFACIAALALALPAALWAEGGGTPPDAAFVAAAAATRASNPDDLQLEHKATTTLADGRQLTWAKVWNRRTGEVVEVTLDGAGRPVESARAEEAARQAYLTRYGKLSESLHARLASLAPTDPIEVAISLSAPSDLTVTQLSSPEELSLSDESLDSLHSVPSVYLSEAIARYQGRVAAVAQPFVQELETAGFPVTYVSPDTPLVLAVLPCSAVEALSQHPGVAEVWETTLPQSEIDTVRPAVRAEVPWAAGYTGAGVRVGISEVGGKAQAANPYLRLAQNAVIGSCADSSHGTAVAGILGAYRLSDVLYRGLAYGASFFYQGTCIGYWSNLKSGWRVLRSQGTPVVNCSWGADTKRLAGYMDKEIDAYVRNYRLLMVKSAGNRGDGTTCAYTDGNVTSPGLGYNVLTVGNADHRRNANPADDTMTDTCSSYQGPKSEKGDRHKPEVVAPGSNIYSTTGWPFSPWIGWVGSGTSYAAPVASAEAAILMQAAPTLRYWPEAIRAIVMASATFSANQTYAGEGGAGPHLSERAGAGEVNFAAAYSVAKGTSGGWQRKSLTYGAFTQGSTTAPYLAYSAYLPADVTVRVVLVWDTNPALTLYGGGSQPSSDLDLRVFQGDVKRAYSVSFDNTYEVVEFRTGSAGLYQFRVYRRRWDEGGTTPDYRTYMGLAWYYRE